MSFVAGKITAEVKGHARVDVGKIGGLFLHGFGRVRKAGNDEAGDFDVSSAGRGLSDRVQRGLKVAAEAAVTFLAEAFQVDIEGR